MKWVYCLYRVSTKKQVDKNENDIPMQKTGCHEFADRQTDWVIQREFSEKVFQDTRCQHRTGMPYRT